MRYEFQVQEKKVPYSHYVGWVAIDTASGMEIPMPDGGTGAFLGSYPEIQSYLDRHYKIQVKLFYAIGLDDLDIHQSGSSTWTFKRQGKEIVVKDIPRVFLRFNIIGGTAADAQGS